VEPWGRWNIGRWNIACDSVQGNDVSPLRLGSGHRVRAVKDVGGEREGPDGFSQSHGQEVAVKNAEGRVTSLIG
jgi:hypothetical protein